MHASDRETLALNFHFPWTTQEQIKEKWEKYFLEQEQGKRTVYLLENQGQILGYASLLNIPEYSHFKERGIPEIHDLWIHEKFRSQGFGKMLIHYLENQAREQGYHQIGLGVGLYRDYGPAQILYCKLGYVPDGNGITYKYARAAPGKKYPVDDDLILWLIKTLSD